MTEPKYVLTRTISDKPERYEFTPDKLMEFAESIWTEPKEAFSEDEDDEIGCQRINYQMLENGGEDAALRMLEEYEGFLIAVKDRHDDQENNDSVPDVLAVFDVPNEVEQAIKWFTSFGLSLRYKDVGEGARAYLEVKDEDNVIINVELSADEVSYRAELWRDNEEQGE